MILDAGALIAVAKNDRVMIARLLAAHEAEDDLRTHALILAQVWRDGRKQAALARLVQAISVQAVDEVCGRRAGELLGKAKLSDAIDAAAVLLARDGEAIVTSDPHDIEQLVRAAKLTLLVIEC